MNDDSLRFRLRQLPREIEPGRDFGRCTGRRAAMPGHRSRPAAAPAPGLEAELVQREVEALTREYEAALAEMAMVPVPEPLAPALATLDQSAEQIREALDAQPGSARLLEQLKRTYSRRLALTQRAALG